MCHRICVLLVLVLGLAWTHPTAAQPGDAENGKDVFKVCRPCHQVGPGARNGIGPTLNGIVGSKAGTIAGFTYSQPNKEAGTKGLVWTEDNLFKYLENPAAFMPGNKMTYAGMKDETDRRDLIAYLKQQPGQ
jgi:cytochrome c